MNDYSTVTEVTGNKITKEAIQMLYTRYGFARRFARGKDVLEVGCGAGAGLGYLGQETHRIIGGDYTEALVRSARQHYDDRLPVLVFDAQELPFKSESFDMVVLFEAIYYLPQVDAFIEEARRVLRNDGTLIVCTVNREWTDFNPSPFSIHYPSAGELAQSLSKAGFETDIFCAYPVGQMGIKKKIVSLLKRTAGSLGLIPKTMNGKAILKRFFLGPLLPVPAELDASKEPDHLPVKVGGDISNYKVVFAVGKLT